MSDSCFHKNENWFFFLFSHVKLPYCAPTTATGVTIEEIQLAYMKMSVLVLSVYHKHIATKKLNACA
jgi:hypothetical protein